MKPALLIVGLCLTAFLRAGAAEEAAEAPASPTAYTAMRTVQKQFGAESLKRIVEIIGREGAPQPFLWRVVLKEPGGGVREVDVAGGKVTAEREVPKSPAGAATPIRLSDLNLDSSGAFDAADAQARKARLRFDSISYVLRSNEANGKPLWTLELFNHDGEKLGSLRLGASDGSTLGVDGRLAATPPPAAGSRPAPPIAVVPAPASGGAPLPPTVAVPSPEDEEDSIGFFTRAGRTLDKTHRTVERSLFKAGTTVQRFFTGRLGEDGTPENNVESVQPPRD